jgi:hypothetical protein
MAIPASQSLVILHITGPGYEANGWKGDTLYSTTEVRIVDRYVRNEIPIVVVMLCQWTTNKDDRSRGGKKRRDVNKGTLRGSRRLNTMWHPLMRFNGHV